MLTERQRRKKSNRRAEAFDEIDLEALTPEAVSENLFEHLRRSGIEATSEQIEAITRKAADVLTYVPKIGLLGKTGVGKSSLCNALFGAEVARIDDVRACTRDVAKFLVSLSEKQGIVLVDVPGIGETTARDAEYAGLYKQLIPQLDLAMWVVKADDRVFSVDEHFIKKVLKPALNGKPLLGVVNQVDKIEPVRDWNTTRRKPGARQAKNIKTRIGQISRLLNLPSKRVVAVSAMEQYQLVELVNTIVAVLPDQTKIAVVRQAKKENRSTEAKREAGRGFFRVLFETAKRVLARAIARRLRPLIRKAANATAKMLQRWLLRFW